MEEADKDRDEAQEPPVLSENQKEDGVSIHKSTENLSLKVKVESSTPEEEDEEEDKGSHKRLISLQKDLTTLVSNTRAAADAEVVKRRPQLKEAQRLRKELIENDLKSSEETSKELERLWSKLNQSVTDQDLKQTLKKQQQLCDSIIQDKYALINEIQQAIKQVNERHVNSLSKHAKEIDIMQKRMEDQVKMLTAAQREELEQTERIHQQEIKALLAKDVREWEEEMREFWDNELVILMERRKKVEVAEEKFCQMKAETFRKFKKMSKSQKQVQGRKRNNHIDNVMAVVKSKQQMQKTQQQLALMAGIKRRMISLETELRKNKEEYIRREKNFKKHGSKLSEEYKRHIQRYECLKKQIKHFAVANAKTYEDMWQMIDTELKELAKRALTIDSVICMKHLGIAWEPPQMAYLENSGPIQPQKLAAKVSQTQSQTEKCSHWALNASSGQSLESDSNSPDTEVYSEGTAVYSESSPEREERNLFSKKQMEVLELLCDEADFLIEPKVLKVLASQQKEKQTNVKLHLLCDVLSINIKDTPQLVDFLLEYEQQHKEQTEDTCAESRSMAETAETSPTTSSRSDLIHPDHILPALQSFLEQRTRFRESSDHHLSSSGLTQAQNTQKDLSHWASLGNIISEDKLKLWDAAERTLKQYHAVLTEISDLVPEIERLSQRNKKLQMKLQQRRKGYLKP